MQNEEQEMTKTQVKGPNKNGRGKTKSECSTTSRKPGLGMIKERAEENDEWLALLTDKKLQIYDSHAVDYSSFNDTSKDEEILDALLPLHLRKNKPKKFKNKTKKEEKVEYKVEKDALKDFNKDLEPKLPACVEICEEDDSDGLSVSSESIYSRRMSTSTEVLTQASRQRKSSQETINLHESLTQVNAAEITTESAHENRRSGKNESQPHDTLSSFLKHYREQRSKDERLKRVQSQATIKTPKIDKNQQVNPESNKQDSFLPLLVDKQRLNQANTRSTDRRDFGTQKLPKIAFGKRRRKAFNAKKDPRFQKLVSSLTPSYNGEETTTFPFIVGKRRRSYTM